jgi:rfaE bifunctional protein kinase chain/domain
MAALAGYIEKFVGLRALVIGDVMLDSYIWGAVERVSPEAPVPVVHVRKRDVRLGGAANVALNLQALGAVPLLVALAGRDDAGQRLLAILREAGLSADGVVSSAERPTTVKTRVIASNQHVVRVDDETDRPASASEQHALLEKIKTLLPNCQVVVFEDYDKGTITHDLIQAVVALAQQHRIPTVVDPKKRNFLSYRGVTLFKPNLKELREGLKADLYAGQPEGIKQAVAQLKQQLELHGVLLTLSEHGVLLSTGGELVQIPAHVREIADVSGAGDTVVSIAALGVALGLPPAALAALANLGGGLVCQHVGVVPINKAEFLAEAVRLDQLS